MVKNYGKLTASQRRRTVLLCILLALVVLIPIGLFVGISVGREEMA